MAKPAALDAAARGDLDALRALTDHSYCSALESEGWLAVMVLAEAITFARLAAAHGDRQDNVNLVFLLSAAAERMQQMGDIDLGNCLEAHSLVVAEEMAEAGDDEMAGVVIRASDKLSAEVFQEAKRQREAAGNPCRVN